MVTVGAKRACFWRLFQFVSLSNDERPRVWIAAYRLALIEKGVNICVYV